MCIQSESHPLVPRTELFSDITLYFSFSDGKEIWYSDLESVLTEGIWVRQGAFRSPDFLIKVYLCFCLQCLFSHQLDPIACLERKYRKKYISRWVCEVLNLQDCTPKLFWSWDTQETNLNSLSWGQAQLGEVHNSCLNDWPLHWINNDAMTGHNRCKSGWLPQLESPSIWWQRVPDTNYMKQLCRSHAWPAHQPQALCKLFIPTLRHEEKPLCPKCLKA